MIDVKQLITEHLDIWLTAETEKKSGRGRSSSANETIYGVQKLRELILDLAIHGKITEQFPESENAEDLYKKVLIAKKELLESENQKIKLLSNIDSKEIRFSIPKNWSWIRLGNIGITSTGRTPKTSNESSFNGNIPFIGPGQITNDNRILVAEKFLTDIGVQESTVAVKGDILTVCIGGSIGKSALVTHKLTFNQQLNCIHPLIIDSKYLYYVLTSNYFLKSILDNSSGSATPIINKGKWENIPVPIAPLKEQQRIIEKVDELMQLCDQLEQQQTLSSDAHATLVDTLLKALTESSDVDEFQSNWQRIVANFDLLFTTEYSIEQLKQTILQLAVMGKLVKQDLSDQPASELLKKIAEEKAKLIKEGKIKKSKPLPEIGEDEKLFELPSGWGFVRLGDICLINSGNAFSSQDFSEIKGLHKVIKITNIGVGEFVESSDYLNIELNEKVKVFQVFENDLLLALTRPYISSGLKVCQCPKSYDKALLNQRVSMIRPLKKNLNEYLYLFLRSDLVLNLYKQRFNDSGLQPNLKMEDVSNLIVPLSPLNEQKRILEKVNQLFSMIEQLQALQSKLQKTKLQLAEALVANAVEGV